MYYLATIHFVTDRQTDRQMTVSWKQPITLGAAVWSAKNDFCDNIFKNLDQKTVFSCNIRATEYCSFYSTVL